MDQKMHRCVDVRMYAWKHGWMYVCMFVCIQYKVHISFCYVGFLDDRRQSHGRAQCVLVLEPCAEVEGMDDASDWHRPIVACKP